MTANHWDHIVIGAGSAGCVLAARLAEAERRVVLIESGPDRDADEPPTHPLRRATSLVLSGHNWPHRINLGHGSARQNLLSGRQVSSSDARARRTRFPYALGRVVGGSSAVNGAVALRALRRDLDSWAAGGCTQWSWAEALPWYRRLEHDPGGDPGLHGVGGPIPITRTEGLGELDQAFHRACLSRGVPDRPDLNDGEEAGVGPVPTNNVAGRRMDAATTHLQQVRAGHYLSVLCDTDAARVVVRRGRAVGVEVITPRGVELLHAPEVTVCAGAVGTPPLLVRSGIGDPEICRALGIQPVNELPGVGEGLSDHVSLVMWALSPSQPPRVSQRWRDVIARLSSGHDAETDLQVGLVNNIDTAAIPSLAGRMGAESVLGMSVMLMRPRSRGRVLAASSDPGDAPIVELGMGTETEDIERLACGVRLGYELLQAPGIGEHISQVQFWTARAIENSVVLRNGVRNMASPGWHPCGTARMGPPEDRLSVVDQQCRVHGTEGLRVVDASIFPHIPRTPTHLTTVMLAERISRQVLH